VPSANNGQPCRDGKPGKTLKSLASPTHAPGFLVHTDPAFFFFGVDRSGKRARLGSPQPFHKLNHFFRLK
jgi:hypothetical protein